MKIWEVNSSKRFNFGCIYLWTNLINGKHYVGQTSNFFIRMREYKRNNFNYYMKEDVERNGIENFDIVNANDITFTIQFEYNGKTYSFTPSEGSVTVS